MQVYCIHVASVYVYICLCTYAFIYFSFSVNQIRHYVRSTQKPTPWAFVETTQLNSLLLIAEEEQLTQEQLNQELQPTQL